MHTGHTARHAAASHGTGLETWSASLQAEPVSYRKLLLHAAGSHQLLAWHFLPDCISRPDPAAMNHNRRAFSRVTDCSPHCTSLHSCHAGMIWCNAACRGDRTLHKRDTGWCMHGRTYESCRTSAGRSGAQQMVLQTCLHTSPTTALHLALPCLAHASQYSSNCCAMMHAAQQGKLSAMQSQILAGCLAAHDRLTSH